MPAEDAWYIADSLTTAVKCRGHGALHQAQRFGQRQVALPLNANVKEGKNYAIQITAPAGKNISLRYKQGPMGTLVEQRQPRPR